jgi:SM-20-related protein
VNATPGPIPPHAQLFNFLSAREHRKLLGWVLNHADAFAPATVVSGDQHELREKQRIALTTCDLGEVEELVELRLRSALGEVMELTGYHGSIPSSLELELAAHGNGAFYRPHLDIPVGQDRLPLGAWEGEDRALSAVYYFHREPRRFSGGELRLHRIGSTSKRGETEPGSYVDIEPRNNTLVAFPSWALHEVRPVSCPSGDFKDYRFALNCWYCRPNA